MADRWSLRRAAERLPVAVATAKRWADRYRAEDTPPASSAASRGPGTAHTGRPPDSSGGFRPGLRPAGPPPPARRPG
ncbi:leucine zipper domain-containing protein [Amycolatopsis sp. CA-128772]|uniref:leucine zipper domain-containing protein n=1 Tax=Amycolatopsis sp. CA-128772 TaxID=2073159 RepID=UPI00351A65E2